ncbi:MAG: response regulator [Proteobacteria bacterium]|nr:response regulator [Pseudomonadota bacterium]
MDFCGARVLIVEDNFLVATDLSAMITASGGTVIGPAGDAVKACALTKVGGPDLAVLDVKLHEGDSRAVVDELERHHVPFLVLTAYEQSGLPPCFAGVPYLSKPFMEDDLLRLLVTLLPRPATRSPM